MKNEWKVLNQKIIYDKYFPLYEEDVQLPNGKIIQYAVSRGYNAAGILVSPKKGFILLAYQYRFPIDSRIYDLPGGRVNKGENPKDAATRECIEETGYKPLQLKKLIHYHPYPSRSATTFNIFFSDKVLETKKILKTDEENVESKIISVRELEKLIEKNKIIDPGLLIAWHEARRRKLI
jgi:ADP-ribose pyrophosphatase